MSEQSVCFSKLKRVCLIGGGDLMYLCARLYQSLGYEVVAILALRHRDEVLSTTENCGESLLLALQNLGLEVKLLEDINQLASWDQQTLAGDCSLALCFGPAWVFSTAVIESFELGMYNINPIPIPHYLGGAHYTWQLLNGSREGGCYLQRITEQLDQGELLASHRFCIADEACNPGDYFKANLEEGLSFMQGIALRMQAGEVFETRAYAEVNDERLYFPRLRTPKQAYIDWTWEAEEIARFASGFDEPYGGARSFLGDTLLCLKGVRMLGAESPLYSLQRTIHPFCAGLVVRKTSTELLLAARGGLLEVGSLCDVSGRDLRPQVREGMRLLTPKHILEEALAYSPVLSANGFED